MTAGLVWAWSHVHRCLCLDLGNHVVFVALFSPFLIEATMEPEHHHGYTYKNRTCMGLVPCP